MEPGASERGRDESASDVGAAPEGALASRARFDGEVEFFQRVAATPAHRVMVRTLVSALGEAPCGWALDLGAGAGSLVRELIHHGHRGVGCDVSRAMLGWSEAKATPRVAADAMCLPFANRSFSVVAGTLHLQLVRDPTVACAEAARVLVPDGLFGVLVQTPQFDGEDAGRRLAQELGSESFEARWLERCAHRSPGSHRFSPEELQALMTGAGLQVVRADVVFGGALACVVARRSASPWDARRTDDH